MYTQFYGFKEKPFNLVPNPSYLYLSSRHEHALTYLEYGLRERVGFIMLTGEIGMGKTTLIRYILNTIETDMEVAVVFNTNVMLRDLFVMILNEFEIEYDKRDGRAEVLEVLYRFLIEQYAKNKKVLLIIDEAQNLSDDILEEIRMLSNLQTDEDLLLQIMIVGQPELREKINNPRLEQFAQRIAVRYHLSAMNEEETREYISHRLAKAGCYRMLFDEDAVSMIFKASGGIPRTINHLCDACLVYGFADEERIISEATVSLVIEDRGGMGVYTKPVNGGNDAPPINLTDIVQTGAMERLDALEKKVNRLSAYIMKRTCCPSALDVRKKDNMIITLKRQLALMKKQNEKLISGHEQLLKRYLHLKQTSDHSPVDQEAEAQIC